MEIYIAGGCSEHGRNSFLVKGSSLSFLVDCGQMKEKPETPWPDLDDEQIRSVKYLFLTHCHADHTGAVSWLISHGFTGSVCASEETFANCRPFTAERISLEKIAPGGEGSLCGGDLKIRWARSGHCAGSVWFLFSFEGRKILFSGDYEEYSAAYQCDPIRDIYADLAILDCAYGQDEDDAVSNSRNLMERLDEGERAGMPMLFPVPSCGRGADVVRHLSDRKIPVYMGQSLFREMASVKKAGYWLKEELVRSLPAVRTGGMNDVIKKVLPSGSEPPRWPDSLLNAAVLVKDSQLWRTEHRLLAEAAVSCGGSVILTGKQDPSSYARKMLNEGRAEFFKVSVHQNNREMLALMEKNHFRMVIPYHCRSELHFDNEAIQVLRTGDVIEI